MIYTEFDPLEEVIVGDTFLPGDIDHMFPNNVLDKFNIILEETKEDLENLVDFLKKGNIKVHRPDVFKFKQNIEMPDFNINFPMSPLVPRDQYKVQGNTIVQTYTSLTDRYFDSLGYYNIFKNMFQEGYNWISQPTPMLVNLDADEQWYMSSEIYSKYHSDKLLWHTATMVSAGDAIILNSKGPGSQLGLDWFKRNVPGYRYIENQGTVQKNYGHIDHGWILVDDDTVMHGGLDWVPHCLKDKKLIDISRYIGKYDFTNYIEDFSATKGKYDIAWLDKYLENWRGYNQEVCFDLNVLIIDSKNIVFAREMPDLFKYLKTFGIDCYSVPYRHRLFWEGSIHCATLDLKRRGTKRKIISENF